MTTIEIIEEFNTLINKDQDYTLAEMKTILSDVYKTKNGKKVAKKAPKKADAEKADPSDDDDNEKPKKRGRPAKTPKLNAKGEEKKKREPSAYNIFIKEKYAEYKATNPEMTAKEVMLAAAAAWTASKQVVVADAE